MNEGFTAILELDAGAREPSVAVILVHKVRPAGSRRDQSASRVAYIVVAAITRQSARCIIRPSLKTIVDESIVGRLSLAPDSICLLGDFAEAVVLITLSIRTSGRAALQGSAG